MEEVEFGEPGAVEGLSGPEAARLVRLERTVDRAVEVVGRIAGEALATIRDERLYRLTHPTFEAYVSDRWGFSRSTAYRMIAAATPAPPPALDAGANVSPRDKPSSAGSGFEHEVAGSGFEHEVDGAGEADMGLTVSQEMGNEAWVVGATVAARRPVDGELHLIVDREAPRYPPPGARVLLSWTTT